MALLSLYRERYSEAERLLREALNSFKKATPDNWVRYNCESMLGASLAGQKNYVQAEPLLLSGYEGMLQRKTAIPAASQFKLEQAEKRIVQLYQDWGKPEKAAEWRKKLPLITSAVGMR